MLFQKTEFFQAISRVDVPKLCKIYMTLRKVWILIIIVTSTWVRRMKSQERYNINNEKEKHRLF